MLGVLAVVAAPIAVFWWLGDRLDSVCREGVPERCGMWQLPQRWSPDYVQLLGIVFSFVFVGSIWLLARAWQRHLVCSGSLKVVGLLVGAGTLLAFSARVLSARIDDDGYLGYLVVGPVTVVAVGLIVAAAVEAVSVRKATRSAVHNSDVERW